MPISPHAVLIFHGQQLVHASPQAAELAGCSYQELLQMDLERLLLFFSPSDARRIARLMRKVEAGELAEPETGLCLQTSTGGCAWIDLLVVRTLYQQQPALQMVWIDAGPRPAAEDELRHSLWRLQILHDIDHAILSVQEEGETAAVALRRIANLVPDYLASAVYLLDERTGLAHLLAHDGEFPAPDGFSWTELEGAPDLNSGMLAQGMPYILQDLSQIEKATPFQTRLQEGGVLASLYVPLRWDGQLKGALNLYSSSPTRFPAERVQVAQEIANLLAVAIQQTQLKTAERVRRREAEAMRDVMSALASAGDLNQTLQAILVNLHNVIEYDHASLYLVDEDERFVVGGQDVQVQRAAGRAFHEQNPLVDQMRQSRKPLVIPDIQGDTRFTGWPEVETVRAWMGAPLHVGEEMIGFISLGSLQINLFSREDAERLQAFAEQVAQVLERAWQSEQTQRRTEELEVLSSVTLALGQAESGENPLSSVLRQIAQFSGAQSGVFLFPDRLETALIVKASMDETSLGLSFPSRWNPLWNVYISGETHLIQDLDLLPNGSQELDFRPLFRTAKSAVLVPVRSGPATFGVLGFGFDQDRKIGPEEVRLCSAVAEIAAASLRRSVILESLERQVDIRTQHLATLYDINTIAGEPLELGEVLERVLQISLESMRGQAGAVHFLSENQEQFELAVGSALSPELEVTLQELQARRGFWARLAGSSNPVVINDTASEPNLPPEFSKLRSEGHRAYIGAPIRAKGKLLGLLSLFDRSILDYTIEDITLFMTIADQIGGLVERARLVKQAEIAAVVQERQRLARELHDSVTQLLYGQVLFSGAGLKVLRQGDLEKTGDHLERTNQAALQALKEMRLLVYQLRPSDYLEEGLVGALTRRLDSVEKRTGINARLVVEGDLSLDEAVEVGLYRIAEEALNNTLKHSQASAVTITLRAIDGRVILEVADNGTGFDPESAFGRGGMGLENMRERAAALGGAIEFHSQSGGGSRICVEIEVGA
jgi:signal transduction histidine kinase